MARYFDEKTFRFLKDLAKNNERDWFNDHKQDYEDHVRTPALAFIEDMDQWIKMISPHFQGVAKKVGGSLMRVYRDVRFSKNKSPYKTNIGIQFRHEVGKDVHAPGFYLHIEPGNVFLGAGIWRPDPVSLKNIREHIQTKPGPYQDTIEHQPFAEKYSLSGESLTRPPKGFDKEHPLIEEIKRKDFIAIANVPDSFILEDDLHKRVASYYGCAQPLMRFLCDANQLNF